MDPIKIFLINGFAFFYLAVGSGLTAASNMEAVRQDDYYTFAPKPPQIVYPTYQESHSLVKNYCKVYGQKGMIQGVQAIILKYYYIPYYKKIKKGREHTKILNGFVESMGQPCGETLIFATMSGIEPKWVHFWKRQKVNCEKKVCFSSIFASSLVYLPNLCIVQQQGSYDLIGYDLKAEKVATIYKGHTARLTCGVPLVGDARFITAGHDRKVCLWEINQRDPKGLYQGYKSSILSMASLYEKGNEKFLTGDQEGALVGWDSRKIKPFYVDSGTGRALQLLATSLGGWLDCIAGNIEARIVKLYDLREERWVKRKNLQKKHASLRGIWYIDNNLQFVTAGIEGNLYLWDKRNFEVEKPLDVFYQEEAPFLLQRLSATSGLITDSFGGLSQCSLA